MIVSLIIVVVQLLIGWQVARLTQPSIWAKARKEARYPGDARNIVKILTFSMMLSWPVLLPMTLVSQRFNIMIDRGDPEAAVRETAQLRDRIAQLEHELGISRDTSNDEGLPS